MRFYGPNRLYGVVAGIIFLGVTRLLGNAVFFLGLIELAVAAILSSSAQAGRHWGRFGRDVLICTGIGLLVLIGLCAYEPRLFAPLMSNVINAVVGFVAFAAMVALISAAALTVARLVLHGTVNGWPPP